MSRISIEKLYANYDILELAKNKSDHAKEYEEIISGVKGGEKEKKLASQFIAKFFKYFPTMHHQALEALFDICEDDDMSIRKQAMKVLPNICKDSKEHTTKVADVLAQLFQLEDPQELIIATNSLIEVIKGDPLQAMKGMFKHICGNQEVVREKCIKFLSTKFLALGSDVITKEVEDYVIKEIKKVIVDTTAEEFVALMHYLLSTKYSQTPAGQLEIIEIVSEQAGLGQDFDPLDKENYNVDRFIVCVNYCLPYFSNKHDSVKYVEYICDKILPQYDVIGTLDRGEAMQMTLLRQLAELTTYCGILQNPTKQVQNIFDKLRSNLPLPPEDNELTTFPDLDYTVLECLLYAFHRLARQCPEFLTSNPNVLKDFRTRLQYCSRAVQGCMKTLKEDTVSKEDSSKKRLYYLITSNINTLIKDLFYTPPSYKTNITLSWKADEAPKKAAETSTTSTKRHAPITIDFDKNTPAKQIRKSSENMKIYTPPSGKFSNSFQSNNRKMMRGRGRGGGRGRGRGRGGWRN